MVDNENDLTPEEMDELNAALAEAVEELFPGGSAAAAYTEAERKEQLDRLTKSLDLREVTPAELSIVLGVTEKRISQLWQAGHIPEPRKDGRRNYFPLLETVNGYITFLKNR